MRPPDLKLRPMTVGDILDATLRLYRHHFGLLFLIAAVVQLPLSIIQTVFAGFPLLLSNMNPAAMESSEMSVLIGMALLSPVLIIIMLAQPIGEGALAIAVSELYLGRQSSVAAAYGKALARGWKIIWTTLLYGFITTLPLMTGMVIFTVAMIPVGMSAQNGSSPLYALIILPAIGLFAALSIFTLWIGVRYLFAPDTIVMLEGYSGINALKRCWSFTTGHFWTVFTTLAVLYLIVMLISTGLTAPLQILTAFMSGGNETLLIWLTLATQAVGATITLFLRPLTMIGTVLVYYDVRIRREGFDLLMMAEALGVKAPADMQTANDMPLIPGPVAETAAVIEIPQDKVQDNTMSASSASELFWQPSQTAENNVSGEETPGEKS